MVIRAREFGTKGGTSTRLADNAKSKRTEMPEIEALLISKGIVSKESLDRMVEIYENDLGPMNGARVVARAWTDDEFKSRLLQDGTSAIGELGFSGLQGEHMLQSTRHRNLWLGMWVSLRRGC